MVELWKGQIVHRLVTASFCVNQCRVKVFNRFHVSLRVGTHESYSYSRFQLCVGSGLRMLRSLQATLFAALQGTSPEFFESRIPCAQRIEEITLRKRH